MNKKRFIFLVLAILFSAVILIYSNLNQKKDQEIQPNTVPSSQELQNKFCKDKDSGSEINYQQALEIAQKNNCGLPKEELVTFSENYLCNEITGTWWVDINVNPKKEGCNPACVVDVVNKTAEINWRCTGLIVPD